jgi:SAM-dependent methyltransferase
MEQTTWINSVDDGLRAWGGSDSSHLLLDLRSRESFQRQRLDQSVNIPWRELEMNWYALPAQVVPFAVLLPSAEDDRAQNEQNRARQAVAPSTATTPAQEDDGAATSSSSKSSAPPPAPSSPSFEYSRAAILELLRFYRWTIPDEWIFEDTPALWQAAAAMPSLSVRGPTDAIVKRILFAPSPYLEKHYAYIQEQLLASRQQQSSSSSNKQARSETAASVVSSSASPSDTADPAAAPFRCLDVACGSGRDICWLLWQAEKSSCAWRATGVDVSASSLERATHLARQLGVAEQLDTVQARINQATGEWKVTRQAQQQQAPTASAGAVPAASTLAAASAASSIQPDAASVPSDTAMVDQPAPKSQQQRREKRKQKDALRAAAAAAAASSSATGGAAVPFLDSQYDLIIIVRFLSRVFFRTHLPRLLKPGGFFLLSTFIEDGLVTRWTSPANPEFRIQGREEVERWAKDAGLEVVRNEIGRCEDGRPMSDTLMRKPLQ